MIPTFPFGKYAGKDATSLTIMGQPTPKVKQSFAETCLALGGSCVGRVSNLKDLAGRDGCKLLNVHTQRRLSCNDYRSP
jgi:hypothetical protein